MRFQVTNQRSVFKDLSNEDKFHISDDLLYDCIGLGCGSWQRDKRVQGFNSGKEFGYALLTYFFTTAFGFRRMPFCEDRVYNQYLWDHASKKHILSDITQGKIENIAREVRSLYAHTQDTLSKYGLKEVNLRREIKRIDNNCGTRALSNDRRGYAETLIMLKNACEILGIPEFDIEMDTLNSFGDEGAYYSEVCLEMTIPVEDVFYFSSMIGNRPGKQETMESGEWVIINRSPIGVKKIQVSSVVVRQDMWKFDSPITKEYAKDFIDRYEPVVFRPLPTTERPYGTYGIQPTIKQNVVRYLLERFLSVSE